MNFFLLPLILINLSNVDVENAILSNLNTVYSLKNSEYVCDFSRLNIPKDLQFDSVVVDGYGKDTPSGITVVRLAYYRDNERIYANASSIRIAIIKEVLVASRNIKIGEKLDSTNVYFENRDISALDDNPITSYDFCDRKVASRFIAKGLIIVNSLLAHPSDIKSGARVEIIYSEGLMDLRANGIAKENGAVGNRIRVMNEDSRKIISAVVLDSITVAIKNGDSR
jgi:flagella basal body P-ring formation protein FlgA